VLHTVTISPAKLLSGNALVPSIRIRRRLRSFIKRVGLVGISLLPCNDVKQ